MTSSSLTFSFLFDFRGGRCLRVFLSAWVPGRGEYLKTKAFFVADAADQVNRSGKVFVRFRREKADDEVAGDGDVRDDFSCSIHQGDVLAGRVAAVHGCQNAVRTGLGRDVQVGADFGIVGHDLQNAVVEFAGMAGDKTDPVDIIDFADLFEQVGERVRFVARGVAVGSSPSGRAG